MALMSVFDCLREAGVASALQNGVHPAPNVRVIDNISGVSYLRSKRLPVQSNRQFHKQSLIVYLDHDNSPNSINLAYEENGRCTQL
jgi:hypothetical protein